MGLRITLPWRRTLTCAARSSTACQRPPSLLYCNARGRPIQLDPTVGFSHSLCKALQFPVGEPANLAHALLTFAKSHVQYMYYTCTSYLHAIAVVVQAASLSRRCLLGHQHTTLPSALTAVARENAVPLWDGVFDKWGTGECLVTARDFSHCFISVAS